MFDKYIVSLSFTLLLISLPINAEIFVIQGLVKARLT
jgi:hypothetical protein